MKYDVVIIGGGPGGYTCALDCASYGLKTAIVEKDLMGGTCLNRGCIPTKTLLFAADLLIDMKKAEKFGLSSGVVRADYPALRKRCEEVVTGLRNGLITSLKKAKIDILEGIGQVPEAGHVTVKNADGETALEADSIVLAAGGTPAVPPIPGADLPGVYDSDSFLGTLPQLHRLIIIGGGVVGCEFAEAYGAYGAEVTILEMMPRLLPPFDADPAKRLAAEFKKKGISVVTKAAVREIRKTDDGLTVVYELGGKEYTKEADGVLIATGRRPSTKDLVTPEIKMNRGCYEVNDCFETSIPHIYAVGDIASGYIQLAHAAEAEGKIAAAAIAGKSCGINPRLIPQCVYTLPEIATVGISEDDAKGKGIKLISGKSVMGSNAKSLISDTGGSVKLLAGEDGKLLGAQFYCRGADNMIGEAALAIEHGMTVREFLKITRPHPSVEEALGAASEDLLKKIK